MTQKTITETKIKLTGIHHFALNVRNMDRAIQFYQDILGFKVVTKDTTQSGLKHYELDAGNVFIALFEQPDLNLPAGQKIMTDDGFLHFAFGAHKDQMASTLEALKEHGVDLDGEPRNYESGTSIYFNDPDGHQLEIHFPSGQRPQEI
jgi:catechol 2,3-dioxygenase-like lactoylglutathione lyase family enzyme